MLKPTNIKRTLAGLALAFAATAGPPDANLRAAAPPHPAGYRFSINAVAL